VISLVWTLNNLSMHDYHWNETLPILAGRVYPLRNAHGGQGRESSFADSVLESPVAGVASLTTAQQTTVVNFVTRYRCQRIRRGQTQY